MYVPAVSNVVTYGNGTGTKNVLKGTLRFGLSLVPSLLSSRRYYCSESKTIFYVDMVYCKFILYVNVEINPPEKMPGDALYICRSNTITRLMTPNRESVP